MPKKIFSSIRYLAVQGIALRGHTDDNSNFKQLLSLRSKDVTQLKSWLCRTKHKWMSHDIMNEVLALLSLNVQQKLLRRIKDGTYFSILADETTDISVNEEIWLFVLER